MHGYVHTLNKSVSICNLPAVLHVCACDYNLVDRANIALCSRAKLIFAPVNTNTEKVVNSDYIIFHFCIGKPLKVPIFQQKDITFKQEQACH